MGRPWIALACVAALSLTTAPACSPLYGGKPEKLKNPDKKKRPLEAPEIGLVIKYIDDCNASVSGDAKTMKPPQPAVAANLVVEGDTALAQALKAPDGTAFGSLVKEAVDKYRNALTKDNYNVEATLQLALAYDVVQRKGCALAMLRRLATLSNHPKFARIATPKVDEVAENTSMFKGYRKDAVAAVGR